MPDRKNQKLDSAGKVLENLFAKNQSPLSDGFQRYRLEQRWAEVVNSQLASCSRPVNFRKGLLTVAVTNPSLLTELQFFREEMITQINTHLGQLMVRKIRFVSE